MIFSDFPFSTDGLNWLELSELYGFIDHSIKEIKKDGKKERIFKKCGEAIK